MTSTADTGTTSSFPKWQIALGLSAVGAIGVGYWYMKTGTKKTKNLSDTTTNNGVSLDESENEPLTPLQQSQCHKNDGNKLFKEGKYDEAISHYNQAIDLCPREFTTDLATFYQNRAAAYGQLKKWSAVIADCTKAIELNARYEKALMRRAKAEEMIKDWENCLDDITCVCLLQQFQNQSVLLMADRVLKELGRKHAAEAIKTRTPILPSKHFINTYFSSFSADPVYAKLLEVGEPLGQGELRGFLKAKLAFATDKYDEIIPACTEEVDSSEAESPFILEALSLRAAFYFLLGSFNEALQDLTKIIDNKDADVKIKVNALIKRASIYMQTEKLPESLADYEKAAELGPDISDVYHHRGQVKLLMENVGEAREDFAKAVSLNPDFSIAYVQKCYSDYRYALQMQDSQLLMASLADFRRSIEKFPGCSETYLIYAQVLTEKQDFEEAENMFKKAMDVGPKNASIYVHRGMLYLQWKGNIEESIRLMKESIKIDDKCEFAYETLGTVEVQRGNLVIAIDLFNKAIELARSEMEMTHLFSLRDAAASQLKVTTRLGIGLQGINNVASS